MATKYVFADEAGNFDFSKNQGASKYFILGTVVVDDPSIGDRLLELRRSLVWDGTVLENGFHATMDRQAVWDKVFNLLSSASFRVDATVLEKSKAQPQTRTTDQRFYQYAWLYHFQYVGPRIVSLNDDMLVIAASLATKGKGTSARAGVEDVV